MANPSFSEFERLMVEFDFRRLENLKRADPIRFIALFQLTESNNSKSSTLQKPANKNKFGWEEDYDFNILYRNINGIIIDEDSCEQCKLNFIGEGEPLKKIICLKPKLFVNILFHLHRQDYLFSDQKLTGIILDRCRNKKGELLKEGTINTYLYESSKTFPYNTIAKIIARLKNSKS